MRVQRSPLSHFIRSSSLAVLPPSLLLSSSSFVPPHFLHQSSFFFSCPPLFPQLSHPLCTYSSRCLVSRFNVRVRRSGLMYPSLQKSWRCKRERTACVSEFYLHVEFADKHLLEAQGIACILIRTPILSALRSRSNSWSCWVDSWMTVLESPSGGPECGTVLVLTLLAHDLMDSEPNEIDFRGAPPGLRRAGRIIVRGRRREARADGSEPGRRRLWQAFTIPLMAVNSSSKMPRSPLSITYFPEFHRP